MGSSIDGMLIKKMSKRGLNGRSWEDVLGKRHVVLVQRCVLRVKSRALLLVRWCMNMQQRVLRIGRGSRSREL